MAGSGRIQGAVDAMIGCASRIETPRTNFSGHGIFVICQYSCYSHARVAIVNCIRSRPDGVCSRDHGSFLPCLSRSSHLPSLRPAHIGMCSVTKQT